MLGLSLSHTQQSYCFLLFGKNTGLKKALPVYVVPGALDFFFVTCSLTAILSSLSFIEPLHNAPEPGRSRQNMAGF